MGGDRARDSVQMDNGCRPATHAALIRVPSPSTSSPLFGPPPRPQTGRVEGPTEPPQGVVATPGTRYPPEPVLEQLTAPTPGVRHVMHRASAPAEQLTDEVPDLALGRLWVLYPQGHIPPPGTSNHLARLGLQCRADAAHARGVVGQCLALHNLSTAQGHWYLHQLLFLPRAAPEHCRQNPYNTHPERLGVQGFPQPAPPALLPGQGQEALLQGPPLDATTTVQLRGSSNADGAEPDRTNCGLVAWTAACRNLARDTTQLRRYLPADRTALASRVAGVTMGPLAAWPVRLLPHVCGRNRRPRQPAATHTPTAPPHRRAAVRRRGGAAGGRWGELCPRPRPSADRG